jgi:hypothetical protein
MGASIHINGTGSSVVDTVFVCRSTGVVPARWIVSQPKDLGNLIRNEIAELRQGGLTATQGDIRCICYGHLIRLAIWNLRQHWDRRHSTETRMRAIRTWLSDFGGVASVWDHINASGQSTASKQSWRSVSAVAEDSESYEIAF